MTTVTATASRTVCHTAITLTKPRSIFTIFDRLNPLRSNSHRTGADYREVNYGIQKLTVIQSVLSRPGELYPAVSAWQLRTYIASSTGSESRGHFHGPASEEDRVTHYCPQPGASYRSVTDLLKIIDPSDD